MGIVVVVPLAALLAAFAIVALLFGLAVLAVVLGVVTLWRLISRLTARRQDDGRRNVRVVVRRPDQNDPFGL